MAVKKRGLGRGLDALLSGPSVSALEEQAVKILQHAFDKGINTWDTVRNLKHTYLTITSF